MIFVLGGKCLWAISGSEGRVLTLDKILAADWAPALTTVLTVVCEVGHGHLWLWIRMLPWKRPWQRREKRLVRQIRSWLVKVAAGMAPDRSVEQVVIEFIWKMCCP